MKRGELQSTMTLVVATLAFWYGSEREHEMHPSMFAAVADELAKKGNSIAARFLVGEGRTGLWSDDWCRGTSVAHAACLIEYESISFRYFHPSFSRGLAEGFLAKFTTLERSEARALVDRFVEREMTGE